MTAHTFMVTVEVNGWDAADGRPEAGYAFAALNVAELPDAARLDGYADLRAEAGIVTIASLDPP